MNTKHKWELDDNQVFSPYDNWYKCDKCTSRRMVSADNPTSLPLFGCKPHVVKEKRKCSVKN